MKEEAKKKVYHLAYPCSIHFDIEADTYLEASIKGVDFIKEISAGLAQDVEAEGVMVYPSVNNNGEPNINRISLENVIERGVAQ